MKKLLITLVGSFIGLTLHSQSQLHTDGKKIIEGYVAPLGYSLGYALNNGWYNTAKPHKIGGIDVTVTANIVIVPSNAKTFNITKKNGNTFNGGETPTILGNGDGANITSLIPGNTGDPAIINYMPKGVSIPVIPLPILQAGVGLIKGIELNFRYMPELNIGKAGKVGLLGVGLKHDILQWIPIAGRIPIDLSIQAGYTKLNSEIKLIDPTANISPQSNLAVSATTINLILSKKILLFTPYLGIGYSSTKTTFNIYGDYNIGGMHFDAANLTNIDFESANNFRTNIGFRFNIAILALQANYTFAEYPTATLGIGVSLR